MDGPKVKEGPKMVGVAGAAASAGVTLVNPRAVGELVSVGTPCSEAKRLAPKRNSFTFVLEKVWVQVKVPIWLRCVSSPPEPTGTLPPLPIGCAPVMEEMLPPSSGKNARESSIRYTNEMVS